jgi:hypothetical protein
MLVHLVGSVCYHTVVTLVLHCWNTVRGPCEPLLDVRDLADEGAYEHSNTCTPGSKVGNETGSEQV